MKYLFITGIPASGKSTLARKIAEQIGGTHVNIDELREEMWQDKKLRPWVDFFINKDEMEYWKTTTPEQDFKNLIDQSEAFWPTILNKIQQIVAIGKPAVFEAVNILPHLAKRDLNFPGIVMINNSADVILQRLNEIPRWGLTAELKEIEAQRFVEEGQFYKIEADKYGYKTFLDSSEAENYLINNYI